MSNIKSIHTKLSEKHQIDILRLHLTNLKLTIDGNHPGTNLAKKTLVRDNYCNNSDQIELIISNLVLTYDKTNVILALRSLKMFKYCSKYLKVS